ncbi:hypothetical protein ASD38_07660 [Caulobacter sp. Root487D2Y]|uniref:hypothetical protein n=1 Tax=Caulobacter sp. Root487D2Y TaxID=1736547 RepID=UPI0006F1D084|nr:hypothetical protein [Caulobacter sp. Root487D2Y]KQY29228.1 hypothetical protein ASD38_07660 [Caulobacter sp. Root487D2Y]
MVRKIIFWALGLSLAAAGATFVLYKPPAPPPKPEPSDRFAAAADKAFVDLAAGKIAKRFGSPEDVSFWDPVISRMPNGAEALCVDASGPGRDWTGTIAVHEHDAAGFVIYWGGDTLAAKARAQCRAILRRALQGPGPAPISVMTEYVQAGCERQLDPRYMYAYARYCTGVETRPAPVGPS